MALTGRIAAGRGLEAVATEEAYSLAFALLTTRSVRRRYLLRVVGQSMVRARIDEDGDLLVVEEDEAPPDGAVIVASRRDGEEVTVKRVYRDGEKGRLRPENEGHEELILPAGDLRVQGRVVYVVHPPGGRRGVGGGS